ncbi:MAG: hypothetical protein Q8M09_19130 [Pseudomonadota bacterium]|nr:hypothetical protein [Pseudomonadota bacterium]MDP1906329.1 hypothetical protein [Pseudomonadota bacterium]MDP2352061.1 hypothetical protein [Pseudomonadota bacterium]
MPDPHQDLAAIIEPAAPPAAAARTDYAPLFLLAATVVLLVVIVWRFWRRRAPLRALRRLARSPDTQAGAAGLAHLMEGRALPESWRMELEQLRFARPTADAATTLARLCREAEGLLRAGGGSK